jgi:hypothetical protein
MTPKRVRSKATTPRSAFFSVLGYGVVQVSVGGGGVAAPAAMKPNAVVAFAARAPFHDSLRTVTPVPGVCAENRPAVAIVSRFPDISMVIRRPHAARSEFPDK